MNSSERLWNLKSIFPSFYSSQYNNTFKEPKPLKTQSYMRSFVIPVILLFIMENNLMVN